MDIQKVEALSTKQSHGNGQFWEIAASRLNEINSTIDAPRNDVYFSC